MAWLSLLGAFCFGIVIGWVTYRSLRHSKSNGVKDVAAVIGAVGGASVTALFRQENGAFGMYCIGLAISFFGYLVTAIVLARRIGKLGSKNIEAKNLQVIAEWLGDPPPIWGVDRVGEGQQSTGDSGLRTPMSRTSSRRLPSDNE